jgi:rhamnose utilization protein RhaD (predicted bifunctional aldolase and dehydrogenase)/NAD(P)-dependent dehydrogenase (short-subunit alcohol dehydrogenase family)
MHSRHVPAEAERLVHDLAPRWGEDLARCVHVSRLLGQDGSLVLHGGGNTSVKTRVRELLGDETEVIYIKGSGADLAKIGPEHFPACRLGHLRRLCELPSMTDAEIVRELRAHMLDPFRPTPSVEALLHAFLPGKFVAHTHADAVLSLLNQPSSEAIVREIYGERALFVPYVKPGFSLARGVIDAWRAKVPAGEEPSIVVLDKHGVFTWGDTAEDCYARMIDAVTAAESALAKRLEGRAIAHAPATPLAPYAAVAPVVRGALTRVSNQDWILAHRGSSAVLGFLSRADLAEVTAIGCATPDHVIRTKIAPLVLGEWQAEGARGRVEDAVRAFAAQYDAYFRRCTAARDMKLEPLDPWPRVVLIPGVGLVTAGKTLEEAEIAADIYEHTITVIEAASAMSRYTPASELDLFDVEYWSLEQAKLGPARAHAGPLDRRIALVTGAASGIGLATARTLLQAGAHVVLSDRDGELVERRAHELSPFGPGRVAWTRCDVTSEDDVRASIAHAVNRFGGLDVIVSNAGAVFQGALHTDAGDKALRRSLDINFMGHQLMAKAASEVMLAQGTGGALLFNASKSAFNQGPDFGPYAIAKTAVLALMRQYAVDLGAEGIRTNAVNADRIRTELFGAGVLEQRARARGLSPDQYFQANLLKRETLAADVAEAFLYLATAEATTGTVITVDGGNAAAFPR